jgi:hypothetical protein
MTENSAGATVVYGNPSIRTSSAFITNPTATTGKTGLTKSEEKYNMDMPSAVSGFGVEVVLSYAECGTDNPTLSVPNTIGGQTTYKAKSPVLTAPANIKIKKTDFVILSAFQC